MVFTFNLGAFSIDEEKKVAVLFQLDRYDNKTRGNQMAYIAGEDRYFKSLNLGFVSKSGGLACSSYVPSLVHLQV